MFCFLDTPVLRFTLLPYYRRIWIPLKAKLNYEPTLKIPWTQDVNCSYIKTSRTPSQRFTYVKLRPVSRRGAKLATLWLSGQNRLSGVINTGCVRQHVFSSSRWLLTVSWVTKSGIWSEKCFSLNAFAWETFLKVSLCYCWRLSNAGGWQKHHWLDYPNIFMLIVTNSLLNSKFHGAACVCHVVHKNRHSIIHITHKHHACNFICLFSLW